MLKQEEGRIKYSKKGNEDQKLLIKEAGFFYSLLKYKVDRQNLWLREFEQ